MYPLIFTQSTILINQFIDSLDFIKVLFGAIHLYLESVKDNPAHLFSIKKYYHNHIYIND
jgi:hypothetical protein